jgi:ankyrin repeat domain-containing protein 17
MIWAAIVGFGGSRALSALFQFDGQHGNNRRVRSSSGKRMLKRLSAGMLALAIAVPAWAGAAEDKALWDAASDLNIDGVKIALAKGANPNASTNAGVSPTPLGAASLGMLIVTGKLRQAGRSKDEVDKYVNRRVVEVTRMLFASGAKLGPNDKNILYFPVSEGKVELVALLIDKGASAKGRFDDGYTPTELAKKFNQEDVYKSLISHGGIPVDSTASAQLALAEAASNGDLLGMENAVKSGATINGFDAGKKSALTAAVQLPTESPSRALTIRWLLDHHGAPGG